MAPARMFVTCSDKHIRESSTEILGTLTAKFRTITTQRPDRLSPRRGFGPEQLSERRIITSGVTTEVVNEAGCRFVERCRRKRL